MTQKLNERAANVLMAVVERYISTSEPVGASALAKSDAFDLGAASIRNVMSRLEAGGFLAQPHTSAGRVPTDEGYRYYAQILAGPQNLPPNQLRDIRSVTHGSEWLEREDLMSALSTALSRLSHQVGMVGLSSLGAAPVKKLQFVSLSGRLVLAVLHTAKGEIRRHTIRTEHPFTPSALDAMTNYFNDRFSYLNLSQIRRALLKELQDEESRLNERLTAAFEVAEALEKEAARGGSEKLYLDGAANLIGEFGDDTEISKIKALFGAFEEKSRLCSLLCECLKEDGIGLIIGSESEIDELSDYSMVTRAFSGVDGMTGAVGILGFKRMNYRHAMALVNHAAIALSQRLNG